jgi:hypothetical protein
VRGYRSSATQKSKTLGPDQPSIKDVLAQRGLTQAVIDEAKAMLASATTVMTEEPIGPQDPESIAAAEEAVWAWYLEWSAIARMAIQDRRLIYYLGFSNRRGSPGSAAGDETEEPVDEEDDVAPVPAPSPAPPGPAPAPPPVGPAAPPSTPIAPV